MFVSVQHPGENSETLVSLTTHWPTIPGSRSLGTFGRLTVG
jgi:secreted PhoX family phosphatase